MKEENNMGMTSKNTLQEVQKLFDMFFDANSHIDRIVYLLDIKFNQPKFQDYVHHKLAHLMPVLADDIQGFGSLRGDLFYRGAIDRQDKDFARVSDAMYDIAMVMGEIENQCVVSIKTAIANNDLMYEDYLRSFEVEKVAPIIKQIAVFYTAIKEYENANAIYKWNNDFESYIISEMRKAYD